MYDFWDTVLFRAGTFHGNPISANTKLVARTDMSMNTFNRWLNLFRSTATELFDGPNAEHIVRCVENMANVLYSKINKVPDPRFDPANLREEQKARYTNYPHTPSPSPEATQPNPI
ncbi:MAG: hypothetical protein AAGD22_11035 [Verrucomicrobiota bacterium]